MLLSTRASAQTDFKVRVGVGDSSMAQFLKCSPVNHSILLKNGYSLSFVFAVSMSFCSAREVARGDKGLSMVGVFADSVRKSAHIATCITNSPTLI